NRFNTRFGVEYFLGEKSSLTGTVLYRKSTGNNISTNTIEEFDVNKVLTGLGTRIETSERDDETLEYSLNFTQDFKNAGHKLTFDVQYSESVEDDKAYIEDEFDERNFTDEKNKEWLFKGDYTLPLGEDALFEFGFKINLDDLDTDYLVEDFENGEFVTNTNFSNTLNFNQNVYSVYTQYGSKKNKFSYLLGLRMENTDRKIDLLQTSETYTKNFTELFPTVNLGYEISEGESITLGYSKRLRRPRHWFLNPFESRTSETYITKGNINLDPTYSNSFDLGWLKRWNKFTLNSSIYYQHSTNNFEMVLDEEIRDVNGEPTLVIIRSPINLSTSDRFGFEFTANYNPFKWWRLSNSFNFYKYKTDGEYNNISYDADDTSWFTRLTSRVRLPGKIDWQTRGMYIAPRESAVSERDAMFMLNLAFSKDVFKEKGTLSLNVSDLLNSRKRKSTSITPRTISEGEFQWRERSITLNFTYRFNQKKQRARQRGGYDDEGGMEEMYK
ncbi:MAG TPA: outer membrane beta-barrel family protein, partial [Flavobacteriaceae bacterium]|nr:outer membrane beta-barrel family protein [Flavobacteriaceae bacterium]